MWILESNGRRVRPVYSLDARKVGRVRAGESDIRVYNMDMSDANRPIDRPKPPPSLVVNAIVHLVGLFVVGVWAVLERLEPTPSDRDLVAVGLLFVAGLAIPACRWILVVLIRRQPRTP